MLMMMGCDYKYENAFPWYKNLDVLIDAINEDGSVKTDDFIPCAQEWLSQSGLIEHM